MRILFRMLNALIPKQQEQICIHSFPDYDDMTRALLNGLEETGKQYRIVILTHSITSPPKWARYSNVLHLKKLTLRGIWEYMRSKYVFFTHGCFSSAKPIKTQISVNIWHGMPIKKIGRYIASDFPISLSTYTVSTSPFYTDIISHAFAISKKDVLGVGLPRNDILLKEPDHQLKQKICEGKKIAIWLPTYRQSVVGEIRLDGEPEKNIFNMPDLQIEQLNSALNKMDVVVIIKPHPMAQSEGIGTSKGNMSNIIFITDEWLLRKNTTLYEILSLSNVLITDISSVLIDYILLDKPIICHFPDGDEYKKTRGLIWDFNPTEYGIAVVKTQNDLIEKISAVINNNGNNQKFLKLKNKMHGQFSNFTASLFKSIGLLK